MNKGEENIDKLYKDAFSGGQFSMNEAMWKDANALIKANKPARTPFLWLGIIAASIISIGSIFYFVSDVNTKNSPEFTQRNSTHKDYLLSDELEINSIHENALYVVDDRTQEENKLNHNNPKSNKNFISSVSSSPSEPIKNSHNRDDLTSSQAKGFNATNTPTPFVKPQNQNTGIENAVSESAYSSNNNRELGTNTTNRNSKVESLYLSSKQDLMYTPSGISENIPEQKGTKKPKFYTPLILRLSSGYSIGSEIKSSENQPNYTYTSNEFNVDFSLEYLFANHWGIQSGLKYNSINETQNYSSTLIEDNSFFDYEDNSYWNYFDNEVIITDSTWWLGDWWNFQPYTDTILDSNYIAQIDSSLITQNDTTQINSNATQKITQLEIPVLVTYNFGKARWNFQVATGASFGVFLTSSGQILNTSDPSSKIETTKGLFNSIQYNYLLSTEVSYHLTTNWRVTARPQMKVNLNSLLGNQSQIQQKYLFYGANIGLAFSF